MSPNKGVELWPKHIFKIHGHIKSGIETLNNLWNDMGLNQESMAKRMDLVEMHCRDMFKTMVEEEEEYKTRLMKDVKRYSEEVKKLASELEENVPLDDNGKSLVIAESELKSKLETLQKLKKQRFDAYWDYKSKDKTLSFRLGTEEYPAYGDGKIPKLEYLEDFKKNLAIKQAEMDRMEKLFMEKREIILDLMRELEVEPVSPLDRNITAKDVTSVRLTKDFMTSVQCRHQELVQESHRRKDLAIKLRETLSLLWDRLCVSSHVREKFHESHRGHGMKTIDGLRKEIKRCEELKRLNIKQFIETLRAEIVQLRQRCLCADDEGLGFQAFESTDYTEELLELHELEVKRLQHEVEICKQLLESLERWNMLFDKQIDLDEKADPERLFANRGGQLLKEEKERKAIQKELPKVEATLRKHYLAWCEDHGKTYKYKGLELLNYIENKWQDYHSQKEEEKLKRKRAKEMLLDQEAKLGTKASGSKRKYALTPAKSPAAKSHCLEAASANTKTWLKSAADHGTSKASQRLFEKPMMHDADEENKVSLPVHEDHINISITSSVATYADFTHHLEILNRDVNCRSSALPEVPKPGERHPTPLRPFNTPRLAIAHTPGTTKVAASQKTPVSTMKTPTRAISRIPGYTPSKTPQSTHSRHLRSATKSRVGTPKLTPRPFLV
ncbi:protein regulator of cytokinesis 1-like [Hetaerina americana]|uniref:protein regulator of cytokinesis 1-like n=1 Tax=Hetaerina americana TaxID=62018 RepID=UPI003A7F1CD6